MIELNEQNVIEYLRRREAIGPGRGLVKSLSGGVANVVLQIMEIDAGEPLGADLRSENQKKRGVPDARMRRGNCFVIKQPLARYKTAEAWLVDRDRVWTERDALTMLADIVPEGALPRMLWSDEENYVLAISAAAPGAVNWKTELLTGRLDANAPEAAAALLATIHNATAGQTRWERRFGDARGFIQQRIDPYLRATANKQESLRPALEKLANFLLTEKYCLIHGDYSPKNMLICQLNNRTDGNLMLLDFEAAFYGHPVFDAATLVNHLLLKAFYSSRRWRAYMIAADTFWRAYRHRLRAQMRAPVQAMGGTMLGALMLARLHGKSPVEYLTDPQLRSHVHKLAVRLIQPDAPTMDDALDLAGDFLGAAR